VTLRVERDLGAVPQPVGVAVYRIVQESLTNVVRHAGPGATATVTITGDGDADGGALAVEITDNGAGANRADRNGAGGTGVGIVGMQERAQATGGTLVVGARPEGGWAVRAVWADQP
jgi:signal transduction histidine kinase